MTCLKIGVFGCGVMGRALVLGMKARFPNAEFHLFTPSKIKAQELAELTDGRCINEVSEMPKNLDWYLLAFKPQSLDEFEFDFVPESKIISILAGVKTSRLAEKFHSKKIIRLMPNTPSSLGLGANLLYLNTSFTKTEVEEVSSLLSAAGKLFLMKTEEDLDFTTPFSGSGPALIFELARIFEVELNRMTDGRVPAREIVQQTFFGSATLMNSPFSHESSFEELRDQVTSKKGVTYEALSVLAKMDFQGILEEAFKAAHKRTLELSK